MSGNPYLMALEAEMNKKPIVTDTRNIKPVEHSEKINNQSYNKDWADFIRECRYE